MTPEEKIDKLIENNNLKVTKKAKFIFTMALKIQANESLDKITNMLINRRDNLPDFEETPVGKKSTADKYNILEELINFIQLQKE